MKVLTKDLIKAGRSFRGGWSRRQVAVLGEDMNRKGWFDRLRGKVVSDEEYEIFLGMKDKHLKPKHFRDPSALEPQEKAQLDLNL
jgi:hypothetical protein